VRTSPEDDPKERLTARKRDTIINAALAAFP
jgi:hypothetical protein